MKKVICLSAAAFLIATLAIGVSAAEEKTIVLSVPDDTYAAGETVTVTISVENFGECNTFMFYDPVYDEEYLEWTGGEWLLSDGTLNDYYVGDMNGSAEQGRSGVYYTENTPVSGDAAIATMEFKVLKESETAQTVSCSVIIKNDEVILYNGDAQTEVDVSGEEAKVPVNVAGTNMILGNDLTMNFWISKNQLEGTDYYAVVTKTYADGRDDVVRTFQFSEWEDYSSAYYRVNFSGIAAKEMADLIYVQIFNGNGTAAGDLWTDSISLYAQRGFNSWNVEQKTWAVDMLNYINFY